MHTLSDDEARMVSRLLMLYPALYNTVSASRGLATMPRAEEDEIWTLANRLDSPAVSVNDAVAQLRGREA